MYSAERRSLKLHLHERFHLGIVPEWNLKSGKWSEKKIFDLAVFKSSYMTNYFSEKTSQCTLIES
jgi:hypothetical protein